MLLKDLRKAIREGKLVDITGVYLRDVWNTDNPSVLHINFEIPSVENKLVNDILDVPEVSLSTKPKYDPCRRLREGDIVEPCQVKGRWHSGVWEGRSGIHFTVTEDENEDGIVVIKDPDCKLSYIAAAVFFNLVTPGEDPGPYGIVRSENYKCVRVMEGKRIYSSIPFDEDECVCLTLEQALAAAEDERDRLNEEWRKKQSNV